MFFCFAQFRQSRGGHGLGEGPGKRGHQFDFDVLPDPVDGEEPVGHEDELQGRHRAFDGHFGDVEDDLAFVEILPFLVKGDGPVGGVEVMDVAAASPPSCRRFHRA